MTPRICKNHGELTIDQIKIRINKNVTRRVCKLCVLEYDRKRGLTEKRKEKSRLRQRTEKACVIRKEKASERKNELKEYAKQYRLKYKNDPIYRKKIRKMSKRAYNKIKKNLSDSYVKRSLCLPKDIIPIELVEMKRALFLLKRKIKEVR